MENPDLKSPQNIYHHNTHTVAQSFRFALSGIARTLMTQQNMKRHVLAALCVLLLGLIFPFDVNSKAIILLCIGLVLFSEIMNTAMEAIVDLYTGETHRLAQIAKDAAAGGVLLLSFCALFIFLWVIEAHINFIVKVPQLFFKLFLVLTILSLEGLVLFTKANFFRSILAQGSALFCMVLIAATAKEPIFSAAAFLLMALIAFAPLIVKKDENR